LQVKEKGKGKKSRFVLTKANQTFILCICPYGWRAFFSALFFENLIASSKASELHLRSGVGLN
jgi:hypothetical protein